MHDLASTPKLLSARATLAPPEHALDPLPVSKLTQPKLHFELLNPQAPSCSNSILLPSSEGNPLRRSFDACVGLAPRPL